MKLTYKRYNTLFDISDNHINSIVVEIPEVLEQFVLDLRYQIEKVEENFILSKDNETIQMHKVTEIITSPFDLEYNKKTVQKKLFEELTIQMYNSGMFEEITEIYAKIIQRLDTLDLLVDYNIDYSDTIAATNIFKEFDVNMKNPEGRFTEKFMKYAVNMNRMLGKSVFLLCCCDSYIKNEDYSHIEKWANYNGITVVFLRRIQINMNSTYNEYIIDKDLCIIH